MGVVEELIRKDADGTLSFGNYLLDTKTKKSDFAFEGATYKIKTFKEITKLEKNGTLVYESVPEFTPHPAQPVRKRQPLPVRASSHPLRARPNRRHRPEPICTRASKRPSPT